MKFLILLFSLTLSASVLAHDVTDHYDRVHLTASAQTQVDNDTVIATLFAQEEGSDAAQLANLVNERIATAVALVKQHESIKLQTSGYNTTPVYHKDRITGWRVRQTIRLESQDMTLMSEVLGQLQQTLNLQDIVFAVSPELKNRTDDELIAEALQVFEQRARNVIEQLGRKNFKIVDINVATGASPYPQRRFEAAVMSASKMAAPAIEGGEQTLQVTVSGQIEME